MGRGGPILVLPFAKGNWHSHWGMVSWGWLAVVGPLSFLSAKVSIGPLDFRQKTLDWGMEAQGKLLMNKVSVASPCLESL